MIIGFATPTSRPENAMTESKTAAAAPPASDQSALDRFVQARLHPDFLNGGTDVYRRAKTAVVFMMFGGSFAYFFTFLNIQFKNYGAAVVEGLIATLVVVLVWQFRHFRSLVLVGNVEAAITSAVLLTAAAIAGGIDGAALRLMPVVPMLALLLAGVRWAWVWMGINSLFVLALFLIDKHGTVLPESFRATEPMYYANVSEWWRAWHGLTPLPAEGFKPEKWRELKMTDSIGGMAMSLGMASIFEALKDQALRMVEQKNQELAQLFDNMRQAIFTFGKDFCVTGQYSGQAKKVFRRDELDGAHVLELLYPNAPDYDPDFMAFQEWLKVVFGTAAEGWDDMAAMVPAERVLNEFTDDEIFLSVEMRPILKRGRIDRVMVLASDETEKVKLAREAAAREAEFNKEMAAMKKLLSGGAQLFIAFMQSASDRLMAFETDLGPAPRMVNASEVEVLFQHAHTVKGEAKAFELVDLEDTCHELEEKLSDLREPSTQKGGASTEEVFGEIVQGIANARAHIAKVRQQFIDASPLGEAVLQQVTVNVNDVGSLEDEVRQLIASETDSPRARRIQKIAERLASRPFGEASGRLSDGVPAWAAQLEKRANFIVDGKEVLVPPQLARVLPGCLTHMVRNCIAHGIEIPEKREALGKDPVGAIKLTCLPGSAGPNIIIEDDGAGLNTVRLREKAIEMGMAFQPGREWELIFASGMSTAETVDDISGRGVGMAAVKNDLEGAGYEIDVHSIAGKGTIFFIRHKAATKRTIPPPAFTI
jgi:HPt (histidine-containing phosphotransfer) domain-containing protein